MGSIELPQDLQVRIEAFASVYRAVAGEPGDFDTCLRVLLERGFDAALADLLQHQDQAILLRSFQQLAASNPVEVCRFIVDTLERGAEVQAQECQPQQIGFATKLRVAEID